jgi:putative hydrolase of the HAD superfamily
VIRAALVDLDDTLYPQSAFLAETWAAVARAAARHGVEQAPFEASLHRIAAEGSGRGGIIDRALEQVGRGDVQAGPLVDAFRSVAPRALPCYPGAKRALARLRGLIPVALITDGDPKGQRAKLRALGLLQAFDGLVLSDEFGREFRKPHPRPFQTGLELLGAAPAEAVMIGDRPDKDVAGAAAVGLRAIRVRTGEYAEQPDIPAPWRTAATFVDAVELVVESVGPGPLRGLQGSR